MNTSSLESLKKAYEQSPDNTPLLMVLIDSLLNLDQVKAAFEYLNQHSEELSEVADKIKAAQVALKAGQPQAALEYCQENTAQELMISAKAHLALFDYPQGLKCYQKAVQQNPALEDPDLEKTLKAQVTEISKREGSNVVGLRMISNEENNENSPVDTEEVSDDLRSILQPQESPIKFSDVGGLDEVKKQIHRKIILPFQKPSLFQKFKKRAGGGVLLYGPPGCGKTLLARATAGECGAQFYNVTISDILDMWIGESEKKLHAVFEQARRHTPSVLFFDELEALAGKRQYNTDSAASKMVSQFLSEMDGFGQNNQGVLILGATNVPWSIDPAFRRPGRFERIQFVPPPDRKARERILEILMQDRPGHAEVNKSSFAKVTSGFSGADISHLIETACDLAIEASIDVGEEQALSDTLLKEALQEIKPTTSEWLTTARNYAKYSNEGGQYDDVLKFLNKYGKAS